MGQHSHGTATAKAGDSLESKKKSVKIERFPGYEFRDDGTAWTRKYKVGIAWKRDGEAKQLKGTLDQDGYLRVQVSDKTGQRHLAYLHRLILEAFVGPCPTGMQACHNNGDKIDNRPCNLRWDTCANNIGDKKRHGTYRVGERHHLAKLSQWQAELIRMQYAIGNVTMKQLAERFGVKKSTIGNVISGRIYAPQKTLGEITNG